MKKANDSGALIALILGEDGIKNNQVMVKYLRDDREQITLPLDKLNESFSDFL